MTRQESLSMILVPVAMGTLVGLIFWALATLVRALKASL